MLEGYKKIEGMLYNYKKTQVEIENLKLNLEELKEEYNGVKGVTYKESTSNSNSFFSTVENEVIKREEKMESIKSKIKNKEIELEKINNAIDSLAPREKQIIYMKYFDKRTNKDIAAKLDLTEVWICNLKKNIVNELTTLILN